LPIAAELTVSVAVADPPELRTRLVGLTVAVNPVPAETDKETVPENPPRLVAVRVEVPEEPASIFTVGAFEARVKSAVCETVRERATECEVLPLVPVTRTV
jgi:hypothetical protein